MRSAYFKNPVTTQSLTASALSLCQSAHMAAATSSKRRGDLFCPLGEWLQGCLMQTQPQAPSVSE